MVTDLMFMFTLNQFSMRRIQKEKDSLRMRPTNRLLNSSRRKVLELNITLSEKFSSIS